MQFTKDNTVAMLHKRFGFNNIDVTECRSIYITFYNQYDETDFYLDIVNWFNSKYNYFSDYLKYSVSTIG